MASKERKKGKGDVGKKVLGRDGGKRDDVFRLSMEGDEDL